jgi:hypothetical protein
MNTNPDAGKSQWILLIGGLFFTYTHGKWLVAQSQIQNKIQGNE